MSNAENTVPAFAGLPVIMARIAKKIILILLNFARNNYRGIRKRTKRLLFSGVAFVLGKANRVARKYKNSRWARFVIMQNAVINLSISGDIFLEALCIDLIYNKKISDERQNQICCLLLRLDNLNDMANLENWSSSFSCEDDFYLNTVRFVKVLKDNALVLHRDLAISYLEAFEQRHSRTRRRMVRRLAAELEKTGWYEGKAILRRALKDPMLASERRKPWAKTFVDEFDAHTNFLKQHGSKQQNSPDCLIEWHLERRLRHNDDNASVGLSGKSKLLEITGGLGPGGAERQFVLSARYINNDWPDVDLMSAIRLASPLNKSDFYLEDLQRCGVPTQVLLNEVGQLPWGLSGQHPELTETLKLMPPHLRKHFIGYYDVIKRESPKIVVAWQDETSVLVGLAAVMLGVPKIICRWRSLRPIKASRLRFFLEGSYRALAKSAAVRFTNNSSAGARDYEAWLDLPEGSVAVIPNGLDLERLRTVSAVQDLGTAKDRLQTLETCDGPALTLGGVMRMSEEKNPRLWLETAMALCERMPKLRAFCIGGGPLLEELRAELKQRGLQKRILLPGYQGNAIAWMSQADLVFNSSRIEGMPNVVMEALALGASVVATDVGGTSEVLPSDPRAGRLIVSDNLEQAVETCQDLLRMSDTDREEGRRLARAHAERSFSLDAMGRATREAYGLAQ